MRQLAESRGRVLGLVAQELHGPALTMLAQAESLPGSSGFALAAEARRLLALSDDITDLLAAEAGPRRLRPEALSLLPVLEEAVAIAAAQIAPAVRNWRLDGVFAAITLLADRRGLRGALVQVLARAARLCRDEDWIELRPVLTSETLAIVVEDEGAGIGAEDLGAGAVAAAPAEATRGLGFGLAVARSLLEAHGGSLRLEALQGVGARFWLTLPRERVLAAG